MDISCAFATSLETPEHIALAEQLGYKRAWCYDSPGLYPDVWMILGLAAHRTSTIELGPGVLVPSMRHPMTNAAAIAGLDAYAPGRTVVAVGTGFTGRMVFGQRSMKWADVAEYVRVLRALLRGEDTQWEGETIRMLHDEQSAPARPIDVPILIAGEGAKGLAVAAELGDGVFGKPTAPVPESLTWRAMLANGTVLDHGESVDSARAVDAYGGGLMVNYHYAYEHGGEAVDQLPGGAEWRRAAEQVPPALRHLAIHEGHMMRTNAIDEAVIGQRAHRTPKLTMTGTPYEVRERVDRLAERGVTELAYQPSGSDVRRELTAFAAAMDLSN